MFSNYDRWFCYKTLATIALNILDVFIPSWKSMMLQEKVNLLDRLGISFLMTMRSEKNLFFVAKQLRRIGNLEEVEIVCFEDNPRRLKSDFYYVIY